jgi:predicted  nucleic acid-binding Zn-ribbon protein
MVRKTEGQHYFICINQVPDNSDGIVAQEEQGRFIMAIEVYNDMDK